MGDANTFPAVSLLNLCSGLYAIRAGTILLRDSFGEEGLKMEHTTQCFRKMKQWVCLGSIH